MVNILKKLKDCPKETKLYSPIYGDVKLYTVTDKLIIVETKNTYSSFNEYGKLFDDYEDAECLLFPSKEDRDWNTFCPFKDGDIITDTNGNICIFKGVLGKTLHNEDKVDYYCAYRKFDNSIVIKTYPDKFFSVVSKFKLSSEEEKEKLFDYIKINGYKWNTETKTLEKLITDKFDISNLIPFESKVLVKNLNGKWKPAIFAGYDSATKIYYTIDASPWLCCIPYEENKHLLFLYKDCDEYYKTW